MLSLITFSENDAGKFSMRRFGARLHGTECALSGNHHDLFICQTEAEEVCDFLYTLIQVLIKVQKQCCCSKAFPYYLLLQVINMSSSLLL